MSTKRYKPEQVVNIQTTDFPLQLQGFSIPCPLATLWFRAKLTNRFA